MSFNPPGPALGREPTAGSGRICLGVWPIPTPANVQTANKGPVSCSALQQPRLWRPVTTRSWIAQATLSTLHRAPDSPSTCNPPNPGRCPRHPAIAACRARGSYIGAPRPLHGASLTPSFYNLKQRPPLCAMLWARGSIRTLVPSIDGFLYGPDHTWAPHGPTATMTATGTLARTAATLSLRLPLTTAGAHPLRARLLQTHRAQRSAGLSPDSDSDITVAATSTAWSRPRTQDGPCTRPKLEHHVHVPALRLGPFVLP